MRCPMCGTEHGEDTRVCPSCGYRRRRTWLAAGVSVAVLASVALVVCVTLLFSSWSGPKPGNDPSSPSGEDTQPSGTTVSRTVMVTIPEGYTVPKIAARLEEEGVCSAAEFLLAVQEADLSDYAFVGAIPMTDERGDANGRHYRLEGYLFPDTYEFYRNTSGEAAVRRFLENFARKYARLQPALSSSGMSLDEAVTLASIIQREAPATTDMPRVSRVLHNRLESVDYPRLQCDVTTAYLRELKALGETPDEDAYDTYVCYGLPVGAIGNPGWYALEAAVSPSTEETYSISDPRHEGAVYTVSLPMCYYFVMDSESGTVYYAQEYATHLSIWNSIREKTNGGEG